MTAALLFVLAVSLVLICLGTLCRCSWCEEAGCCGACGGDTYTEVEEIVNEDGSVTTIETTTYEEEF